MPDARFRGFLCASSSPLSVALDLLQELLYPLVKCGDTGGACSLYAMTLAGPAEREGGLFWAGRVVVVAGFPFKGIGVST